MLVTVAALNAGYLYINCPIDLSGDEAQYWDWSRRLDWSYYSKGPGIALAIRAFTSIFGETMQGVRIGATFFFLAILTGVYVLTRVLFASDQTALRAVVLCLLSPIMIYLSGGMTIDPPMIACWTWASVFAALAMTRSFSWWAAAGVVIGIGFLFKYSAFIWFAGLLGFLLWERAPRRQFAGAGAALAVACVFTIPVIAWNARHGWIGARHVATQTGASGGQLQLANVGEMVGGQFGAVGPTIAIIIVAAIAWTLRQPKYQNNSTSGAQTLLAGHASAARFLLAFAAPFWLATFLVSFAAKVQVNWPAPAYVTLIVLAAAFLGDRMKSADSRRTWRPVMWATLVIGLGAHVFMRDSSLLIPPLKWIGASGNVAAQVDALSRLRGFEELGRFVGEQQRQLGPDTFVLCGSYQQTALMAFYVPGRPRTFHAGLYFTRAQRMNQYALWPDMRLDQPHLLGRNAVYVGKSGPMPDPLPAAFENVERLPDIPVVVRGVTVETFKVWRCRGFRGLKVPNNDKY